MIRRPSPTVVALKSHAEEKGQQPAPPSLATPVGADDTEWERALFLQPARLAEARRHETGRLQRWSGLLLAGLAALAVGVGDIRAEDGVAPSGEESTVKFDYWTWLASWFGEPAPDESQVLQKNEEGNGDPTEGN